MDGGASEKVLFKTRKGLHLQFDADPSLDQWANSGIKHNEKTGEYVKHTGEALNRAEQATYKQYRRRHMARCRLGDAADKLSRITDKYMPRIADEGRVFIMKFPKQAPQLLKRVRKIRRKVEAKQKGDRNDISEGPSETADRRQRGTKATSGTPPHRGKDSKDSKQVIAHVPARLPKKNKTEERLQQGEKADDDEESVPDWGDDASGGSADAVDAKEPQEPADAAAVTGDAQSLWLGGERGRPSDRGDSTGVLGQRPSEPATAPKRQAEAGGSRQPLQHAIRLVQAHMARRRAEQGPREGAE